MNKVLAEEFSLDGRDDCKEYLEKCMKGGVFKLPAAYYKVVLANEKKLPFDQKILYSEFDARESRDDKAAGMVLDLLPKMVPKLTCVKEGESYLKMVSECERLCKLYDANVRQNKCKVM